MSDIIRPSDDIKRRLLAGEAMTSKQVAVEYSVSTALLGAVMSNLKKEGFTFTANRVEGRGQPKEFRVKLPTAKYDEREWHKGENVVSLQASAKKVKAKAVKAAAPKPPTAPKPRKVLPIVGPVPALGATLRVDLLMVNDDGVVGIGIRNGTQAWTAEIVGYTEREEQFDGN